MEFVRPDFCSFHILLNKEEDMIQKISMLLIVILFASCTSLTEEEKEYITEINDWHKKRIESLNKRDSWLSLAGLSKPRIDWNCSRKPIWF